MDGTPLIVHGEGLFAGKYHILREIGHGGMGVVYLADHVEMGRPCALKMLRSSGADAPDAIARFHREARNASRISHPNVVSVYDFGRTDDGSTYLAMEFVEGRSLDTVLREEGPFTPRRAARIVWQIADGLTVAHDLDIIHRDLKPANIMLTRYRAQEDFVKVVDFGVAKVVGATAPTSKVTSTGLRIGTPAYMSPEQRIDGEVDSRSDTYSLALIAIEMLSGAVPSFPLGMAGGGQATLDSLADSGHWPDAITNVFRRALATNPAERQETSTQFATELVEAVIAWEVPTPGVREPWDERLARPLPIQPARRRGALFTVTVFVGVVTVGLLVLSKTFRTASDAGRGNSVVVADSSQKGRTDGVSSAQSNQDVGTGASSDTTGGGTRSARQEPGNVARSRPDPDSVALLRELVSIDNPDTAAARRAVDLGVRLLARALGDSARVEVWYSVAEARIVLDDIPAACRALREAADLSSRSGFMARSIQILHRSRC